MKPGDLVLWEDKTWGHLRLWRIESVLLGAEKTESLVRMHSLSHNPGADEDGVRQPSLLVPEVLLRGLVYQPAVTA